MQIKREPETREEVAQVEENESPREQESPAAG